MREKTLENLPNHLAIIPDGNRRWAKEKGLKPWDGHDFGAQNTEKLVNYALKRGVRCLTFWGSSMDNLKKRPLQEKRALLDIYKKYFKKLLDNEDIHKNEARINFIGRWEEQFPDSLKKTIRELIEKTKNYEKRMLNFMLAYSGDDEMVLAISRICERHGKDAKVSAKTIKENLMTKDLPPVDYMVRTGGDPHLSAGFMMWDTANAQLYFAEDKYPDFNEEKLEEALEEYARRQRRFGK